MRVYKPPLLSKIAFFIVRFLPNRMVAAIWLELLDDLMESDDAVPVQQQHHDDGSTSYFDAISIIRLETRRRKLWTYNIRATLQEVD